MAENWCKEHKQPFFKKGNMKGFAHPILDDMGEPTGEWCNAPKSEGDKHTAKQSSSDSPEKIASIEAQTAYNGVPLLVEVSVKYPDSPLIRTAVAWALGKLGGRATPAPQTPQAAKKAVKEESSSPAPTETEEEGKSPTTVRDLMTWWSGHGKTYTPTSARKILGLNDKSLIPNIGEAYEVLNDSLSLVNEAKKLGAQEIES